MSCFLFRQPRPDEFRFLRELGSFGSHLGNVLFEFGDFVGGVPAVVCLGLDLGVFVVLFHGDVGSLGEDFEVHG